MIQDIAPSRLDNTYSPRFPGMEDRVLVFDSEGRLYAGEEDGRLLFTMGRDVGTKGAVYLFSVDGDGYFLAPPGAGCVRKGFSFRTVREVRDMGRGRELFAAFTAYHLWKWYADNRFCGRCGGTNEPGKTERSLVCARCGCVVYPRINPAVIVGVVKGDCLLITRYRTGFAHNALVAGFTEIGETLEETVAREVMEETGVKVKNIRYYKSQPWGMAQDILAGFFCEADGEQLVRPDEQELKYAEWVRREDIVPQPNDLSLTNEMMKLFIRIGPEVMRLPSPAP